MLTALPMPFPGHNIPMGVLGTKFLFFGWSGMNSLTLGIEAVLINLVSLAAVNTLLAGAWPVVWQPCFTSGGLAPSNGLIHPCR